MNLSKISNGELTTRLEKLVVSERKITHVILLHILEIELRRIYAELGFDSMLSYLIKHLNYSEASAYRRLQAARFLKMIPAAAEKLENGSLNLTQLTQFQKCLKMEKELLKSETYGQSQSFDSFRKEPENKIHRLIQSKNIEQILLKIENKNSFETNKILAIEFNQTIKNTQVVKPQKDESVRLEITLTKEQFAALKEAKNLASHSIPNGSWAEVIGYLADKFNKSVHGKNNKITLDNDSSGEVEGSFHSKFEFPRTPATQNHDHLTQTRTATQFQSEISRGDPLPKRSAISIKIKRQLLANARHRCEYVNKNTQRKCESNYQLQIDHIHPVSLGGTNEISNLQIICRTHNDLKSNRVGN